MIAEGALGEVEKLAARRLDPALPVMRAHGVPHLIAHLEGRLSLAEAAERAKARHPPLRQAPVHLGAASAPGFEWVSPETAVEAGRGRSGSAGLHGSSRFLMFFALNNWIVGLPTTLAIGAVVGIMVALSVLGLVLFHFAVPHPIRRAHNEVVGFTSRSSG